ncbi:MAG: N-acetyltransferase [Gemmatimonadales bacterium]|jgi:hypothetical protein|nr:N-acetyltransferase [Gemmatimonadales bacterium]MBT7430969.1 N-acetyltransferase [Ilumatobacter sp.]
MRTVSHRERPDLIVAFEEMESGAFPDFMLHDDIWNEHWPRILETFPDLQLYVLDGEAVAGVINTVPVAWDGSATDLPGSEHDVLIRSLADHSAERSITALVGIQIAIADSHAGTGLTEFAIGEARRLAADRAHGHVIFPVRPTLKHRYPTVAFDRYIDWTRDDGLPFDPWIRAQVRNGASRLGVCREPMVFTGTVAEWEEWSGLVFKDSGEYVIDGALELLSVDLEGDKGRLEEINVWYVYNLGPSGASS